jgi:aspartate/methionine/tyrosine aminotransferase
VPDGSYFVTSDISGVTDMNAADYCRWLVREGGVAAIPLSGFYVRSDEGETLVRFCFCKKWETLQAAAERLMKLRG